MRAPLRINLPQDADGTTETSYASLLSARVGGVREPKAFIDAALNCLAEFLQTERGAFVEFAEADGAALEIARVEIGDSPPLDVSFAPPAVILDALMNESPVAVGGRLYAPLVAGDRLAATLTIESATPRSWSHDDGLAAIETVERIWPMAQLLATTRHSLALETQIRRLSDRLESALQASPVVAYAQDEQLRFTWFHNPNLGVDPNEVIGKTDDEFAATPGETYALVALKQSVLATGVPVHKELLLRQGAQQRWFDINIRPKIADGRVVGVIYTAVDVTERKLATLRIAQREAQFSVFIDNAPAAIVMFDADMRYLAASRRYISDYLPPGCDPIGRLLYEVRLNVSDKWKQIYSRILSGETLSGDEDLFLAENGRTEWVKWTMTPWRKADGDIGGVLLFTDIVTPQVNARNALRESEERIAAIVEQVPVAVGLIDTEGRFIMRNSAMRRVATEVIAPKDPNTRWLGYDRNGKLLPLNEYPGMLALRGQSSPWLEFTHPDENDALRWYKVAAVPSRNGDCVTGAILVIDDITEQKNSEERIRLLMREIDHRARNMLSVVQSIARFTATSEREDFVSAFENRICALALSQEILIENHWTVVALDTLMRRQLAHFGDLFGTRIRFSGPEISLSPASAQGLGLAVHELMTNAVKHGALSLDCGSVDIVWDVCEGASGRLFKFRWKEQGGPPVTPPTRHGFGKTVLCSMMRMLLSAKVAPSFEESGFCWTLECPAINLCGAVETSA